MPSTDSTFTPTTDMAGGSPKTIYLFFLLNLCSRYFDTMKNADTANVDVDRATASLIAFCPDVTTRERLWTKYLERKNDAEISVTGASVYTVGDLISYLSDTLEFIEKSTGGVS